MSSSPSTAQEFLKKDSPSLSPPTSSANPFVGYNVQGILRKNNFSDVPDGQKAITNILTNAFGVNYTYGDISVVNNIKNSEFNRNREYKRLYGNKETGDESFVTKDTNKVRTSTGLDATAIPLQTVRNKFDEIVDFLGSPSGFQGGDGLIGEYYSWESIYGNEDDIVATGAGTYVADQVDYASPNTFVQPEDDESFFAYDGGDLEGKPTLEVTQDWENGLFNFGTGGLHPNAPSATGIVKYYGYFNPGTYIEGKAGTIGGFSDVGLEDNGRLFIVEDSAGFVHNDDTDLVQTTVPVIWKFWELDSNGDRLSSIPTVTARFAPKLGENNSPVYEFTNAVTGISINDKLDSPDSASNLINDSSRYGKVLIIAPRVDDSPESTESRTIVEFKRNTFYETELYFIVSPRVSRLISDTSKSVYLAGYDRTNNAIGTLRRESFWSKNPLKGSRGAFANFIDNSIQIHGSKFDSSPSAHVDTFGTSSTNNNGENYRSLLSNRRIRVTYKPPKTWSDIDKGLEDTEIYRTQQDTQPVSTVFQERAPSSFGEEGNLVIDDDSPDLGPFDTFTYIKEKVGYSVPILSKPTIRTKDVTNARAIDHKGLKGYGKGSIKLLAASGINGEDAVYLSPTFYNGESPAYNDIIIFENYDNSPYVRVFDTKGPDNKLMVNTLSRSNSLFNNTIPFNSPNGSPYHTHHTNIGDEKYFVYHYRGITDKSLDGFCSDTSTGKEVFQAIVDVEAAIGSSSPAIQKDTLFSYDGNLIVNADDTPAAGGLLGKFVDYNGETEPNSTLIRKVLDGRLPSTITLSGFGPTHYDTPDGTYILDQYGNSPTTAEEQSYEILAYKGNVVGNHFYRKSTDSRFRVYFNSNGNLWTVTGPRNDLIANATVRATASGTEYSPPAGGNFTTYVAPTNAGSLSYTATTDEERNRYTLIFTDANSGTSTVGVYTDQTITQTLKKDFGITITDSPTRAKVQYQCFPPTDTAPPFRATADGLRTLPDNVNNGRLNRLTNRYASPTATNYNNTPLTSIKTGRLTFTGIYGDSPAGSRVSVDASTQTFNRKIKFIFKNKNNVNQTFSILATTDPSGINS